MSHLSVSHADRVVSACFPCFRNEDVELYYELATTKCAASGQLLLCRSEAISSSFSEKGGETLSSGVGKGISTIVIRIKAWYKPTV